jgi:N-dimethylarginine dimethylaminohydrolase
VIGMKLLMCPPDFYGIEYEINPWMDIKVNAERKKATQQWDDLYRILTEKMGITVELLKPVIGLPDLVFTANGGCILKDTAIVANFCYSQRAKEEKYFLNYFKSSDFKAVKPPDDIVFEGEGDILIADNTIYAGYRFRSNINSHKWISDLLKVKVISLELIDPRFYHLDTCFCPLSGGEILYYPGAFDSYALRVIESQFPAEKRIIVKKEDALLFSCNAVEYKKKIVIHAGTRNIQETLEKRGYRVFQTDLSEFLKAGGSAKCLTLYLER